MNLHFLSSLKTKASNIITLTLLCFLSYAASAQITAGGALDNVYDRMGNVYNIQNLAINDTARADTGTIVPTIVPSGSTGYYQLYLQQGCGFDNSSDPDNVARLDVLNKVLQDLSAFISSPLQATGNTVKIFVCAPSSVHGSVSPAYATSFYLVPYNPSVSGIVDNVAWSTIHSGQDAWGGLALQPFANSPNSFFDILISVDISRYSWHTDLASTPPASKYDLYTVLLAQLTHALGWHSLISSDGTSVFGNGRQVFTRADLQYTTSSGISLLQHTGSTPMTGYQFNPALNASTVLSPNPSNCISDSTNCDTAVQYSGSVTIPMYTPNCFEPGVSLSCPEDQCYSGGTGNNNYFVTSNITQPGVMKRYLKPEERLVLTDLGYTTDTVYGDTSTLTYCYYGSTIGQGIAVGSVNIPLTGVDGTGTMTITGILSGDLNSTNYEDLRIEEGGSGSFNVAAGNSSTNVVYSPGAADAGTVLYSYVPVDMTTFKRGARSYGAMAPVSSFILCQGTYDTVTCAAYAGCSYYISTGLGTVATINATTGVIYAVGPGTFYWWYGNALGSLVRCSGTGTVVASPSPISAPAAVCLGSITTWSDATPGGTWNYTGGAITPYFGQPNYEAISYGTAIITYNLNNNPALPWGGCIATETVTVINVGTIHGSPVCPGGHSTMTESVSGGTWSVSAGTGTATISTGGTLYGVTVGTVNVSYGVTVSGVTCYATLVDTVEPNSPATITGYSPICSGTCDLFSVNVPGGTWTSSNGAVATVASAGNPYYEYVCGLTAGNATITYTFTDICGTYVSHYNVTVITGVGSVSITGATKFCGAGGPTTLVGHPTGGTWGVSDPSVVTITTGGVVHVLSSTAYGYVYYDYAAGGCSGAAYVPVYPTVAVITGGDDTICQGYAIYLTGSGDGDGDGVLTGYSAWSSSTTATALGTIYHMPWLSPDPTYTEIEVYGAHAGTSKIKYTFTDECGTFWDSTYVTVIGSNDTLSGPTSVCGCAGTSVTFHSTVTGTWSTSDPTTVSINPTSGVATVSNITTSPITVAIYHEYSSGGCVFTATEYITVNPCPNTIITGPTVICSGESTIYADATPGGYWSSSSGMLTINNITGHASASGLGGPVTITYTDTNSYGCIMIETLAVTVDPITAGAITVPSPLCVGNTGTCTSTALGGTWSVTSSSIVTINATTGAIVARSAGTTTISYSISNICGNYLATQTITVNPNPTISGPGSLCANGTITLTAYPGPGSFSWLSGPGSITAGGVVTSGYTLSVPTAGYLKFVNSTTTCYSYDTITIDPAPVISGPYVLCLPAIDTFTETPAVAGTWSSSNSSVATVSSTGVVYTVGLGITTITFVITSTGCSSSQIVKVCATPVPVIVAPFPASPLCAGHSTIIHAIPGSTGGGVGSGGAFWTTSDPSVASVSIISAGPDTSSAIIYGLDSGVAYITYTVVNGCGCWGSVVDTITVNPSPTLSGRSVICNGTTTDTFRETTGETGIWTSSDTSVAKIDPHTGAIITVSPGTTVITFTNSYGCSSSMTLTICIQPDPVVVWAPGPDTSLCVGQSTTIQATPAASSPGGPYGTSWTSSNTSIASVTTVSAGGDTSTATIYALDTGTAYITYTVVNNCGCWGTVVTAIHVHPIPVISGPSMICYGYSGTFIETTGLTGTWTSSNTSVATIDPTSGVITTVSPGTTTITFTSIYGCTVSATLIICAQVDAETDGDTTTILCVGGTTVIHGTPGAVAASGDYTVSWTSSDPDIAQVNMTDQGGASSTATITGISTGTALITYTAISGCSCMGTRIITITITAPVITGPSVLCMGTTGGTFVEHTGVSGTWSSSNHSVATINSTTGVVTTVGPGTTIITFTSIYGCTVSLTLVICPQPAPVIIRPNPGYVLCVGSTSVIEGSPGTTEQTGPYQVSWSTSDATIASVSLLDEGGATSTATVSGIGEGVAYITYSVKNSCGCVGIVVYEYYVSPIPVLSGPTVLCMGTTGTATESPSLSGTWTSSNTSVATINSSTGVIHTVHPGTTVITFTSIYGCSASYTLTVCAWTNPIIIANPAPVTTLCVGTSASISASPGENYDQDETFNVSWSTSDATVASVTMSSSGGSTSSATVYAIGAGTAYITYVVSSPCGCNGYVVTQYTISPMPAAISGNATTVCAGSTIALSETSTDGSWSSSDNTLASVDQQGNVTGVAGGTPTISYGYTPANGGCAATYDISVTDRATVCVTSGYSEDCNNCWAAIFSGTDQATVTYHVEDGNHNYIKGGYTTSSNSAVPYAQLPQKTAFVYIDQVTLADCSWSDCGCANGCYAAAQGNRGANPNQGSVGSTTVDGITVIPNPNKGTFALSGSFGDPTVNATIDVEIIDMLGKVLYADKITTKKGIVDANIELNSNIANGIYFLKLKNNESTRVIRFTLDR